jgi:hypothetical protein
MDDDQPPCDLNKPSHMSRIETRIAGFIGGGVAGVAIGVVGLIVATNFGFVPLSLGFYGLVGCVVLFTIVGAIWPKWFAWIIDLLSLW